MSKEYEKQKLTGKNAENFMEKVRKNTEFMRQRRQNRNIIELDTNDTIHKEWFEEYIDSESLERLRKN